MLNFNEHIEEYLDGQLSEEDQRQFEAQLAKDTDLQKSVDDHRIALEAVDLLAQKQLKQQLRSLQLERQQKKRFLQGRKWMLPAIAAAVLLLVVVTFLINLRLNHGDEALFADNYETYSPDGLVRGDSKDLLQPAYLAYQKGDFKSALALLGAVPEDHPDYETAAFYRGISALEENDHAQAKKLLQIVIENQNEQYAEPAEWFLALNQLKQGKEVDARDILYKIANNQEHGYHQKSVSLLEDLNSIWR